MINTYLIIILFAAIISLFNSDKSTQVYPNYFIDNFLSNTTKLEVYGNNITDIYLNNQNISKYYTNITNYPNFNQVIKDSEYDIQLIYKIDNKESQFNYAILVILIAFFLMINLNSDRYK